MKNFDQENAERDTITAEPGLFPAESREGEKRSPGPGYDKSNPWGPLKFHNLPGSYQYGNLWGGTTEKPPYFKGK